MVTLVPAASQAQNAPNPDTAAPPQLRISDSSGVHTLDTIRVRSGRDGKGYIPGFTRTATRSSALPRDVPQSLVTVTSQLAHDAAMQNLGDVVRLVPGATMGQGEGNRDQVTIRGNSSTADFFVDGVRDDTQYFRDLYNVDRIEALKGPNAMMFGRGGGGGILNRVTKEANGRTAQQIIAEAGSFGARRITTDLQQSVSPVLSARLSSVYENSSIYRDGVSLERSGFNPTVSMSTSSRHTRVSIGYEYFNDHRTADRGIPSYLGKPVVTNPSTFFGDPRLSRAAATVNAANATVSHDAGTVQLRSTLRFADYDKYYRNIYPGSVTADGSKVSISGYDNSTGRRNILSQTDLTFGARTGDIAHEVLVGADLSRQSTDNYRQTAWFNDNATSALVRVSDPVNRDPVTFRQSASDANNSTLVSSASAFVQDQVSLTSRARLIAGVRFERFALSYHDARDDSRLERTDDMISPRVGLVVKPVELLSVYASYGVSFLPGSGDQFASLTETTRALEPERFANYEAGVKWDVRDRLALTAALYRLDRANTRAVDPANPRLLDTDGSAAKPGARARCSGKLDRQVEYRGWIREAAGTSGQRYFGRSRRREHSARSTLQRIALESL